MSDFRPPSSDMNFILEHVVGYRDVAALPGFEHADLETVSGLLDEAADFMSKVVAPTNRIGDKVGAQHDGKGNVTLPPEFKKAYGTYVESGWNTLQFPEQYGGGGFPSVVGLALQEMLQSSNMAFALCPLLTQGAIDALLHYGSDEQKNAYLPKMVSGEWTGTMNLTEPQAGSDVGALTTKAVPNGDGTYAITGQKIYITWGEHDMAEQIVHLVLARTPGAPAGTRGISCFIVPKFILDEDGNPGERNAVTALSIEHKMGIHGSPTCVLNYEGATGYLIGEENMGMRIMFVMMNVARLSVGMQGVALSERAFQQSLAYAKDRRQGLAIGATGKDSAIIEFPDVRRMILTQKASIAAIRRLMLLNASYMDIASHHPDAAERTRATEIVGLLTPICKSFGTDLGNELTSIGLQVHGGMGFIEETGAAQYLRDSRILPIYEGTTAIQANDLVGRKTSRDGGRTPKAIATQIAVTEADLAKHESAAAKAMGKRLHAARIAFEQVVDYVAGNTKASPNAVFAGSVPYLMLAGNVVAGWQMARALVRAEEMLSNGQGDAAFLKAKVTTAHFYADHLLSKVPGARDAIVDGADSVNALALESF